jgi:NADPH:quinone reductase-like Zn-dependent oxidoreductase
VNPCDVDYVEFGIGCSGGKGTRGRLQNRREPRDHIGPGTLGMDVAGTVVAVGDGVSRLKVRYAVREAARVQKLVRRLLPLVCFRQVGDEVWADGGGVAGVTGTMAQYALLSEEQTGLKPASMNVSPHNTS